jgi:ribonuclease HI
MAVHNPIDIASVNMRRRNAITHALLNSDSRTDIYLIQEPWFDTIGTARQDTSRQGVDILGGVSSPGWEILYPAIPKGLRPKVMTYVRKHNPTASMIPPFTVVPRIDVSDHPCVQVMDVVFDTRTWRIINFYHDVRDSTCLGALTSVDIDALTPTLVVGDFNTHSATWSPPGVPRSRWAGQVEEWAASNSLVLANNPGEITHRGAQHERDSVIDLAWYNAAAIQDNSFSDLRIDWEGSLGSDHASLRISGRSQSVTTAPPDTSNAGFVVDPEMKEEWIKQFKDSPPHLILPIIPTAEEVEQAAAELFENIQTANENTFRRRQPTHPKAAPWWNNECAAATRLVRATRDRPAHRAALTELKRTVRTAKRKWADEYIESGKLWDVANWRHGRRVSKVPSLHGPEGIVHSHEEVAGVLSERFFAKTPPRVDARFHDDPPRLPTRLLPSINKELIEPLLQKATARSAPGQSGHTWTIIKWTWEADAERIVELFEACLAAGHHPKAWKEAVVCVIPKPNRADYTFAKNFRPISLLECLGKLLEKVVAKLLYRDMDKHQIVPTTQFGGRNVSSTLDAGLALLHDIQSAQQAGLQCGILLFDIQGFFDNINHERLVQVLEDLGFAPEIVRWCRSFLQGRTVRLRFNGRTSDPFDFPVGTPQGSPISPVLSIIYTAPLLHKMRALADHSLGMYIDDGAIFACGRKWKDVEGAMRNCYAVCVEWLTRAGLNVEPEKSELLFFRKRKKGPAPPNYIHLPLPAANTYYRVQADNKLRYLGFFLDSGLTWSHHVEVMCNRARATIKALQLLGNSVRGLEHAKWRLAYNAICLPVLTYGCQLWYTGKQRGLVKKLQIVQNEAVRVIAGVFRTTPREPLHQLLTILPMDLRLEMLTQNTALRLYRVAGDSQLLRRLGGTWLPTQPDDQSLPTPNSHTARTTLRALAARVQAKGPRIQPFPDLPPDAPSWGGRVTCDPKQDKWDYQQVMEALVTLCKEGQVVNIFTMGAYSNRNRDDSIQLGATSAVLYHNGRDWKHLEKVLGESATEADAALKALSTALDLLSDFLSATHPVNPPRVVITTPSSFAINKALNPSPHDEQNISLECLTKIGELMDLFPVLNIQLLWLPRSSPFVGFKRAKQLALEAIRSAELTPELEPHTIKHQKKKTKEAATASWADRWHKAPRTSLIYRTALTKPPDGRTHPTFKPDQPTVKFSRRTSCTLYRLATGHAFTGDYTRRFFSRHTQEQVACPCGEPIQTVEHLLLECPNFTAARQKHLTANGRLRNLSQLFNHPKRVSALLSFLQETGAGSRPRTEWEPG